MTKTTDSPRLITVDGTGKSTRNAMRPIVLEYRPGKQKKKKRYSKGLGDAQRMEARLTRINRRVTKAIAKGSETYEKERNRSARSKKDGAIVDMLPNMGEALSVTLSEISDVPADIADAVNTKRTRRLLKRQLRMTSDTLRLFRL